MTNRQSFSGHVYHISQSINKRKQRKTKQESYYLKIKNVPYHNLRFPYDYNNNEIKKQMQTKNELNKE